MKMLHMVAFILLCVGGLNIGLTAVGFNVVGMLLGSMPSILTVFNVLVGASAAYLFVTHKGDCKTCSAK